MKLFVALTMIISISCSKSEEYQSPKITIQLLTEKEWMLAGFGMDFNNNDRLDMNEDESEDCQRDNLYLFNKDGSGLFKENLHSCNNGISEQAFNWKLTNKDSELDFLGGRLQIMNISDQEMLLSNDIPLADGSRLKILIRYQH